MTEKKTYLLEICGLERKLPILAVSPELCIASFVILGDTELVCRVAPELVKKLPALDVIVTPEAKGIPLAFEISRLLGMNYIIARKSIKPYMDHPLLDKVVSITTQQEQLLCLDGKDAETMNGKRVVIVDDVISTGESIHAAQRLVEKAGGIVVAKVAILAEGDAKNMDDIIFLQELPLFPHNAE